jgi:transposase
MSEREASREFGVNRRTVKKMLAHPVPPGYQQKQPRSKPKFGGFLEKIEEILSNPSAHGFVGKQRLTGQTLYAHLRNDHGYTGGPCQVRRALKGLRGRNRETFIPLVQMPGEAQADFGENWVEIAGERVKAHTFVCVLPQSDVWFIRAYPKENLESFLDGHVQAFRFFGKAPSRMLYDNAGYVVKPQGKALKGRERELSTGFLELKSAFLFEAEFAAPRKGNEKGSVERHVATLRSGLLTPIPKAESWEALNQKLYERARENTEAKADAFAKDALEMRPLADYEPCRLVEAKSDKLGLACFETCHYSVPPKFAMRTLLIRATPFEIQVLSAKEVVATHKRSFERGRIYADLAHYIDVLERKPRAVRTAVPVIQAGLPDVFEIYRRKVYDGTGTGDRKFVEVLRMSLDFGKELVAGALKKGLASGTCDPADVKLLVLKDTEATPASVCMDWKSPREQVSPTVIRPPLSDYTKLLGVAV